MRSFALILVALCGIAFSAHAEDSQTIDIDTNRSPLVIGLDTEVRLTDEPLEGTFRVRMPRHCDIGFTDSVTNFTVRRLNTTVGNNQVVIGNGNISVQGTDNKSSITITNDNATVVQVKSRDCGKVIILIQSPAKR